jgi:hypothetical protein
MLNALCGATKLEFPLPYSFAARILYVARRKIDVNNKQITPRLRSKGKEQLWNGASTAFESR